MGVSVKADFLFAWKVWLRKIKINMIADINCGVVFWSNSGASALSFYGF
jgi:hypothetical protein